MPSLILLPFLLAAALALAAGGPLIRFLQSLKAGQAISSDAPQRHQAKAGTPTMGGLIILASGLAAPLVLLLGGAPYGRPGTLLVGTPLCALVLLALAFTLIGFLDDFLIVRRGKNLGLKARQKLAGQFLFAAIFVYWVHAAYRAPAAYAGSSQDPVTLWIWSAFQVLLLVGMSNAVNLTDGLDGLAGGVSLPVWIVLAILATYGPRGDHGVAGFAAAFAGGTLGYLWFNAHPAQVFMGDTGSLPIGAAMAGAAILTGQEWILLLAGGVHVVEAASVTLQVISFKTTGRRIFRMSPLHHHFELAGWPETRVVMRFTIASVLFSGLALWLALRGA
jgi:phospho-N-acetylmuramoyl-pentapeptide-transferase